VTSVATRDGRTLELHEYGDPAGFPVVVHHGTPSSGVPYEAHDTLAREQGVRVVGYDRPGYGGSTRAAGRRVADCAADVEAIADALALERFGSWGVSGGGPHVLACAALCDGRLVAAVSLASVAPWDAEGLDWLAGMGDENEVEFAQTLAGEGALRPYLEEQREELLRAEPDQLAQVVHTLLGPEDRSILTGAFCEYLLASQKHGLEHGVDGWLDDDLAFAAPWGFELEAIARPVLLLHGQDDRFVPVTHGRWLAERIPGVEARIGADDGHLTLVERRLRVVHEWLLRHS